MISESTKLLEPAVRAENAFQAAILRDSSGNRLSAGCSHFDVRPRAPPAEASPTHAWRRISAASFQGEASGVLHWLKDGSAYLRLESAEGGKARRSSVHEPASGPARCSSLPRSSFPGRPRATGDR